MPAVTKPANQKGDYLVDYEQKVFEDAAGLRRPASVGYAEQVSSGIHAHSAVRVSAVAAAGKVVKVGIASSPR